MTERVLNQKALVDRAYITPLQQVHAHRMVQGSPTHPINAVLNYGYAIVATMIKRQCVLVGLDTAVGSLHADSNRRDSLVYDLLELVRADIDKNLLSWAKSVKWRRTDFKVSERGVVSLDANLRRVVGTRLGVKPLVEAAVKKYVVFMLKL